jgi:dihydroxyacetone kinase-like protein
MQPTPAVLPALIQAIAATIAENAEEVTALDQAIGDGDHVINLQRGIEALMLQSGESERLDWAGALQKIGMTLMTTVGGASGSLYGTLFMAMGKAVHGRPMNLQTFSEVFAQGVEAVKQRGRADIGEKTMLDVLIPVATTLQQIAETAPLPEVFEKVRRAAERGCESTRDMLATKGRASFLGERAKGHLDAGAKTSQLMISAIVSVLAEYSTTPT